MAILSRTLYDVSYMDGRTGVGNLPKAQVDADAGDIFSKLKIGAMLYLEATNGQWAVTSDLIYMDLRQDVTGDVLIESGEFSAEQLAWELAGLKRLAGWLEVGIGGRLNNMKAGLDVVKAVGTPKEEDHSLSETWVDPILIVRTKGVVHEKWLLQFRGDFGGFGIGSDFAWQLQAYGGYRFSRLFQLTAGYRVISIDYGKGTGQDRLYMTSTRLDPSFGWDSTFKFVLIQISRHGAMAQVLKNQIYCALGTFRETINCRNRP